MTSLQRALVPMATVLLALAGCEGTIDSQLPVDGGIAGGAAGGQAGGDAGGSAGGAAGGGEVGGGSAGGSAGGAGGGSPVDAGALENVHFIGRFDVSNPAQPRSDWSGTGYVTRFKGTGIGVTLEGATNQFAVVVDQGAPTVLKFNGQPGAIALATNLPDVEHTLELYRRTEASFGPVRFKGFTVTGGALVPTPAPFSRRMEVIGDSISCGYGDEGAGPNCSFSPDTENEFLAYGALTARALSADHHTIAWSGRGMVRNYGGDLSELMPVLFGRTLASDSTSVWDPARYLPDVVVIDLGTNDFSTNVDPGQPFADAYLAFLVRLRGLYPQAEVFCAIGPMNNSVELRTYVSGVVAQRINGGDTRVHFVEFVPQGPLGFGCDSHPSLGTQQQMATTLSAAIHAVTGW